eukprot:CAMPEP_0183356126 /NCGR_PEP_ID=MMETSP0164_2-20130417/43241_1 /TAXON_ID=221442 /ORGANISM="Coccolithus pelagicus ssp braarudi, Strain PLY182g" /LENGTH=72 /DNA_ID=CAMNT_0025529445 /DNA_START=62 /DNA_END=277 /DNA_ORIENTATION=+
MTVARATLAWRSSLLSARNSASLQQRIPYVIYAPPHCEPGLNVQKIQKRLTELGKPPELKHHFKCTAHHPRP